MLQAVTLEELRQDPKLTPQKFAKHFDSFRYVYHDEVQTPEAFLLTEAGDCDDYATLADLVLREKGYTTRLVAVRMPGITHVVCYVVEVKAYLDFNNRVYLKRLVSSDGSLKDIARKVAKSFEASWTSASEFTYSEGLKRLVQTISKTDDYTETKARAKPSPSSQTNRAR
ncbi:MAG: transglutaminase domain-containing protein [Verrucomicrobiota bacterium]|jgi:soluble cytochrome b562